MEPIQFTIVLPPRTKKNTQRVVRIKNKGETRSGRVMLLPSKEFTEYQKSCGYFMPHLSEPISTQVNIKAIYYMPTRRRVDITNLHSALHDILVHYGVIADDNCKIVIATDGSRVKVDRDNPRTEVEITEMCEITGFEEKEKRK